VPGHCDIRGNEEADRLVRMGLDSHFWGPEPSVTLSASIVRDMNRRWVIDAHSKHWITLNSCRQSKLKHPKLQTNFMIFITGYCFLNKHLDRMGLTTSPVCASCQLEEETTLHFVCVCPTLATLRTRIFGKLIMNASEFAEVSSGSLSKCSGFFKLLPRIYFI
jgi:hypothetical protein